MDDTDAVTLYLQRNRILVKSKDKSSLQRFGIHNMLTVFDYMSQRYDMSKRYAYLTAQGDIEFPRTVNLTKLQQRITQSGLNVDAIIEDSESDVVPFRSFTSPITIKSSISVRDTFQNDAVHFLCNPIQGNMHIRLLSMPTGYGKTFCALYAACHYKYKTLIIVSSLTKQWIDQILEKTTCQYNRVFEIAESIDTVKDLISGKIHQDKYDIYVATVRTLANALDQGLYIKLLVKLGIGLTIVDEFHIATYTINRFALACNTVETIYLTATARRSNPNEQYAFENAFHHLPQYGEDISLYAKKYLNTIWVMYNTSPTHSDIMKCMTRFGFHTARFAEQIWQPQNLGTMMNILQWIINTSLPNIESNEKIVIIVELLKHSKMLVELLQNLYPNIAIGEYTSNVDAKEKGANLQNQIIISTDSSFGTGTDLRGTLRVLVNTTTYSSKVTAIQLPGRIREIPDKESFYIDMVNIGYKRTYDHYRKRRKIIDKISKRILVRKAGEDF